MSRPLNPYTLVTLTVECHAGYRGEEQPRALSIDGQRLTVTEILDRWLAPDHRHFKLRASNGAVYIVRNDVAGDSWELVMYAVAGKKADRVPPVRTAGARIHRFYHPRKRRKRET